MSPDIKEYLNTNFGIMFWQNIDDNPRYTMVKGEVTSLRQVTLSIPMAIFLLTAAGIVVTLRALRLSPVKLMRGHGQKNKVGIFEKNMNLRRFKFKTKFIIREILRSFSKIIIIILGVTASSMLLLLGSVAQDSFDYLVKDGMNNSFKYKYNYVFKTPKKANTYKGEEYNAAPFTSLDKKEEIIVYGIRNDSTLMNIFNIPVIIGYTISIPLLYMSLGRVINSSLII